MVSTPAIKKCIYFFDIICLLLAAVLIGFGTYILCTNNTNDVASMGAYGYIAIGVATFVVFIFLNFGAIRENVGCTVTFMVLMVIVILAQSVIVIFMIVGRNSVASNISNTLDATWEEELKNEGAMSIYEEWLVCCGRASPQDYIVSGRLPPSTCFTNGNQNAAEDLIETGCRIKFEDYWRHLLNIFNILGCVLIGLEVLVSVFALRFCISMGNDRRRSYY
ncbi:23 kDa integral membrane protein [Stomoxys calcitrans]|uniref:23 kDa integral membrane protein n=1 Tax=Stomoxys calcitrans TaxID=35570 RepID=UPI0027E35E81|nr:23 kDa integral membrane protein [Stomoxys calcitrans]XP_013098698.2 23 kDa integral membrane protein [Stomoxys calcitrans]XP_013098699.2 23 kDa integral membrane protein [Stomoxys calcitrans]XP_013098700.2 23 kDa integral membrane protein [Stomoxys calcitrans]XP_013098701.2 23 kDa integral membrane protein [Stomoxys calcitrans]XP_013098703.2 23 kDa integral membrane protein [Stomoxys calcitrans]XP_059226439.1 23 kDa integral membrane protein [Stomoxys calcitrans]XP_059226440.1 23 kDa int